ncbi:MAG: hypothetical protein RLZZ444_3480 [Pseudomonadota bacterium]|jgi:hypothetical protein
MIIDNGEAYVNPSLSEPADNGRMTYRKPEAADSRLAGFENRYAESPAKGRRGEDAMLARLSQVLDDLLCRAQELAAWIVSAFEHETSRLGRQIAEARMRKLFPPPADAARPPRSSSP